jgi:Zn-dependent M28 family amino/carboxypeptidase
MSQSTSIRVDGDDLSQRLYRHVDMLAGLIGPRHEAKPSTLEATQAYLHRQFLERDEAVDLESFPSLNHRQAVNLVASRPGQKKPEQIVILGAHYDTVSTTPGADDNASAVAMLLEVSRLLKGVPAKQTLRLVLFANEEPPHFHTDTMGSQYHARQCRERGDRVKAMICLEMVGYYSDAPGSQDYPMPLSPIAKKLFGHRGNFITVVSNFKSAKLLWPFRRGFKSAVKFPCVTLALPEAIHDIRLSDHGSFWDQKYPAVMVTDTSFHRNPHYHQPSDTPDTLNYPAMAKVTIGVAGAVAKLCGMRVTFQQS